jgi:hypothetical protein
MGVLVLITGTGRSGTSTMSGTLHHLGLHVPGPYLGANESNPKGFFESKWAVGFHKDLTKAARIHEFDSRPGAFERVQSAITPQVRDRLVEFLAEQAGQAGQSDQVVVKDPRSVWTQRLWADAAREAGLELRCISMLRHPAEVVGSRSTYYANSADEAARSRYETFNVARWVNNSIISERETRGLARAFVRYTDLLDDWRPVLATLAEDLGLHYDVDVTSREAAAVDDFIDPDLRRHRVTWDELQVPAELRDVAQRTWDALEVLADHHGVDEAASADLDELGARYRRIFEQASAISHDATEEAKTDARRAGADAARQKPAARPADPSQRPVGDLGTRALVRVLGGRFRARLARRGR